ncbi:MAG TPA: hypothetical protein VFY25_05655 [Anaerolineales bacterium]|nr:hypothetical protein [Anaerolineales bacterium]
MRHLSATLIFVHPQLQGAATAGTLDGLHLDRVTLRLADSATRHALTQFTWHEAQKRLLKFYDKLLA